MARGFHAHVLARHVITHDCRPAKSIVTELFSEADYRAISMMASKPAAGVMASKMKSV